MEFLLASLGEGIGRLLMILFHGNNRCLYEQLPVQGRLPADELLLFICKGTTAGREKVEMTEEAHKSR